MNVELARLVLFLMTHAVREGMKLDKKRDDKRDEGNLEGIN